MDLLYVELRIFRVLLSVLLNFMFKVSVVSFIILLYGRLCVKVRELGLEIMYGGGGKCY